MKKFILVLLEKNQHPEHSASARFGDCLKQKRLEKGLNLNEATKGIVASSYLSKVENHTMKGEDFNLKLLAERVGLEFKFNAHDSEGIQVQDRVFDAIEAFYNQDLDMLIALKEQTTDPIFTSSKQLMEGFIAILKGELFVSKEIIEGLWSRYQALALNDQIGLSLLYVVQSYYANEHIHGYHTIQLMDQLKVNHHEYNFLMNYYGYLIAETVENPRMAQRFFNRANRIASKLFNHDYKTGLHLNQLMFLNETDPEYVFQECIKRSSFKVSKRWLNIKTLICLKNALALGHHCPDIVLNEKLKDDAYYEVKWIQAKAYKQFDDEAFESVPPLQLIYKKLYELAKLTDPAERAKFLRSDVLPELKVVYLPQIAREVYQEMAEYQRSINRYKEADSHMRQLTKYIQRIESV